jgi:hypothetical protein
MPVLPNTQEAEVKGLWFEAIMKNKLKAKGLCSGSRGRALASQVQGSESSPKYQKTKP